MHVWDSQEGKMAELYVGQKEIGTGPLGRREVEQEMHIPGG